MTGIYYSQNNDVRWKNIVYSKIDKTKTIGTSGCGITSPAMILSTILKKDIFPPEIATFSLENGYREEGIGTSYALYPALAKKYNVDFKKTNDINTLISLLKQGWLACMGCASGSTKIFSNSGHIIALMGITQEGKIIVHDPYLYKGKFDKSYRSPYVEYEKMDLINGMDILISPSKLNEQLNVYGGYNCFKKKDSDTKNSSILIDNKKTEGVAKLDTYKVNVSSTLRVRKEKNTQSLILGNLNNGEIIDVLETDKEWATIYYNSQIAYVSKQYLIHYNKNDELISDLKNQIKKLELKIDVLEAELQKNKSSR